jgi:AraC family transcriptional activator FtrA
MATARRHRVASVIVEGMTPFEPSVASEVFDIDRSDELGVGWYQHRFVTEHPGRVRLRGGFDAHVDHDLSWLARADTIVIPGWCGSATPVDDALAGALRRAHRRGARLVSFCTGAFALAGAGLLDGRRATTHWERAPALAERFPAVDVDPSVLYVEDDRIFTSAGSAASIDLALHLVRRDFGADVANHVARDMVVPPHRDGGQAQFIDAPVPTYADTDPLASTIDWALAHLDEDLPVERLAAQATMSVRTFIRRFRQATGTTPLRWLIHQRVSAAQRLLETTDLPVERIATECGFGTAASLRAHFQRQVHCSPQAYRNTFAVDRGTERSA